MTVPVLMFRWEGLLPAEVEIPAPAMTTMLRRSRIVLFSRSICDCCSEQVMVSRSERSRCWVVRSLGPTRLLFLAGAK